MNLDKLREQLAIDEGKRLHAYLDTEGILTIGIGHNCVAKPVHGISKVGDSITEEACDDLFANDILCVLESLDKKLPWWRDMNDARQNVLANMCFMGIGGLLTFHNTLKFMEMGNYVAAANGMLASKWATQVGDRAKRLARQMESGEF